MSNLTPVSPTQIAMEPSTNETDRLRLAREAFVEFHAECFWYLRPDLEPEAKDIAEIAQGLRRHGGRRGFLLAERLCR